MKNTMPDSGNTTQKKRCRFCKKKYSEKGVYTHEKYHCKKNPDKLSPRRFQKEPCPVCGKRLNGHYLRIHICTQHAGIYAKIGRPKSPDKILKRSSKTTNSSNVSRHDKGKQSQKSSTTIQTRHGRLKEPAASQIKNGHGAR